MIQGIQKFIKIFKNSGWEPFLVAEFYNSQKELNLQVPVLSVQPDFCSASHFYARCFD